MKNNQYYFTPFLLAILLHVVVFVFIFFAFNVPTKLESTATKNNTQPTPIVKAIAVNQADVEKEVSRLEQQQQQKAANRKAQQRKLYQQKMALKRQQQRAAKAERALKAQTARLKKHQQQLAKQQSQFKKQQAAQQAKLKKQQAAREALLKKQQAEKALQAKVAAEQKAQAAARAKQINDLVNKYNILIRNAIYPNWFVSSNQKQLSADLLISLAPSGTVLNVSVAKSSGSTAFDNLAVAAVYKSSPLPVPKDPQAFAMFRQFNLKMLPQNIASGR